MVVAVRRAHGESGYRGGGSGYKSTHFAPPPRLALPWRDLLRMLDGWRRFAVAF